MAHVPYVPVESLFSHGLANTSVACVVHARHHLSVELANALQLLAGDREAAEGGAGVFVKVTRRRLKLLLSFWLDDSSHLW